MKTAFFNIAALAFTAISGTIANPAPNGMAVDISERDGVLEVREVVSRLTFRAGEFIIDVQSPVPRLAFNAESVFISVVAAPLVMEAAMLLSMLVVAGVEITASLDVLVMDRLVSSGVSKFIRGVKSLATRLEHIHDG
jgi:hypothetical protein